MDGIAKAAQSFIYRTLTILASIRVKDYAFIHVRPAIQGRLKGVTMA
jgi:hypothetical protein